MYPAIDLSRGKSDFDENLQVFIGKYTAMWRESTVTPPIPVKTYTQAEQRANEREAGTLNDLLDGALRNYPGRKRQQSAWRDEVFRLLRRFGTQVFGYPDSYFDIIFSREYFAATRDFVRDARAFDRRIETRALAQALRNVWIMNCLQLFFGRRPSISTSILAYSLLYPYTDNHLDRADLSLYSKKTACERLERRLSGEMAGSVDAHESAVFRLVQMIEEEFPRSAFPDIYSSLLAIHAGQIQSLRQQQKSDALNEQQLLHISVAKGGSSVLADGWLVEGNLNNQEADFCFGYGVALQLLDDLQDLKEDSAAGHRTLFTLHAATGRMDRITNRLWAFLHRSMHTLHCFDDAKGRELRALICSSGMTMILNSMAEFADLYSGKHLRYMEGFSPMSFTFLRNNRKEATARFEKIWPSLARRRKLRSVFDLLG